MTASFPITLELLSVMLRLPEGTRIHSVISDGRDARVIVEHDALKTGECLPTYERRADGEVVFVSWGQS